MGVGVKVRGLRPGGRAQTGRPGGARALSVRRAAAEVEGGGGSRQRQMRERGERLWTYEVLAGVLLFVIPSSPGGLIPEVCVCG